VSAWKVVELGDVAEFVRGINFKPDDVVPVGTPGSVACMRTKNVQSELDCSDVWGVDGRFVKRADQFLETGDILVSSANSWNLVGKCCWIPDLPWRATFGGFVSVLRPHRTKAEPRFLFRWFSSDRIQTTVRSFGQQTTNISNLSTDRCLRLPLPLPPLAEQRRVAEVLDRAEALQAKRLAALAQLDTLTQSIFLDLFGDPTTNPKAWPTKPLASLVRDDDTINYGVVQPGDDFAGGVPLVRVGDLLEGRVNHAALKTIAPTIEASYKRSRLRGDEVLVSCVGSTGVVAMADESVKGFNIARAVARIPLAETTNRVFVAAYLKTDFVQRHFTNELRTVSQPTLNIKQLSETTVILPPRDLQREFAHRIAAIENLRTAHRASLAKMDALFCVLQHRAFRGEL
jgi:type I restriction enzyme S subunit